MSSGGRLFDVTAIGEALLRFSVEPGYALEEVSSLAISVGGAEANVVSHLGRMGFRTAWAGLLPANMTGDLVATRLQAAGVDLSLAERASGRLGLYFVEHASSGGVAQVVYDREHSAAQQLTSAHIDWPRLLDTRVLLLSGITPALGETCQSLVLEAQQRARTAGVTVAFDVNYRAQLWTPDAAKPVLRKLVAEADVVLCSQRDAHLALDLGAASDDDLLDELQHLSGARYVALTRGEKGVLVADGDQRTSIPPLANVAIRDGIGAGDAVTAGALAGLLAGRASFTEGVRQGARMAEVVLERFGDAPVIRPRHLATSAGSGARINR